MIKFKIEQTGAQTLELHTVTPFNVTVLNYLNNSNGIAVAEQINRYSIVVTTGELFDIATIATTIATVAKSYYTITDAEIDIILL